MPYPYQIIRSKRKTLSLEINKNLEVIVRAPLRLSESLIANFVKEHESWIAKAMARQQQKLAALPTPPSQEDCAILKEQAKAVLPPRIAYFSQLMGLTPTRITITGAKTRFGSCSPKNALSFSCFLMQYPPEAIDYVVVHELAHIRHHNHSKQFWALVEQYMPDYKERRKLLK